MKGLIRAALGRPRSVTVVILATVVIGLLCGYAIPTDILPVFNSPAVQVLTFYGGMSAENVGHDITNRMERWVGQSTGMQRQESRSILGASIVRNYYAAGVDPNGALTEVNSLASAAIPNLPPGTLPPVVLKFDPTGLTPACLVAVDSKVQGESILYDVGRYEVRNMIMSSPGAVAPVVYGGKLRAVLAYLNPTELDARGLSPVDVMKAIDDYNLFLPTGDAKFGRLDFAIDSNSMFRMIDRMGDIPLRTKEGNADYLRDVATPQDASMIQENIVRIDGRREVYIPVFRQAGSSTLAVVDHLKASLPNMEARLSRPGINLKMVMDQSVYVRQSISSLATEGVLGAVLCSLVILIFLGEWRLTVIAILMIPISVIAALACLYAAGQTINVMTLAGLALAIGPLVDTAIVCLENTHRHLSQGETTGDAAYSGAAEVVLPELVATCSTLLVLAPLAILPGSGQFLFKPMALSVAFAMIAAFLLGMTFVPTRAAAWLRPHPKADHEPPKRTWSSGIQRTIESGLHWYQRFLRQRVMQHRLPTVLGAFIILALMIVLMVPILQREFFPASDAGYFEIYARAETGTRIEITERRVAEIEDAVRKEIGNDLDLILSELGVRADWSAAYTPNTGPMDAVIKVQLIPDRRHSSQTYVQRLRTKFAQSDGFSDIGFAFNAGGAIQSAMNQGKATPLNVSIRSKDQATAHAIADSILTQLREIDGIVDARVQQRLDYPQFVIDVDRVKSAELGLDQRVVMENVIAALNSSIQFNKKNFWIDPINHNQYYVGVQYPERDITSVDTILNISVTSPQQPEPIPLRNVVTIQRTNVASEVTHSDLQATIDVVAGVHGRDLGHVADDVRRMLGKFGQPSAKAEWTPFDPEHPDQVLRGSSIVLSGEYQNMQSMFFTFGIGLSLTLLLIYCMMVILLDSYLVPVVVLASVPVGLIGVIPMLWVTGTAINVQSLLGVIFMIGIIVANTVLLTDFAQ
ncbi:MAG TPA: efflux RND transporter permease subunit, partial [Planctomycetaceae bacterium]|nr:efflux RND transporter permease subunit [Planctomycetaceae bacterium]